MSGRCFTAHFYLPGTTFAVLSLNTPIFLFHVCSFGMIGQTVQPPFVKPLHEIADFFIAPVLKDNQPLYSESFLVLFSSARSMSGKQLASLSLSLFNYSLKGYYYYNYVLWPFDQQGLIGYFFFAVMFCVTKHTIVNHCYVIPHSADSPMQKKEKQFFQNWSSIFIINLTRKQSFGSDQ